MLQGMVAGGLLLLAVGIASAQQRLGSGSTGSSSFGSGSNSFGSGSTFGAGGSGAGGFGSGGNTGSGGFGSTGMSSTSGFGGVGGTSTFRSTSPFSSHMANPLAAGAVSGTSGATRQSGIAAQTPWPVVFGQPSYGTAAVTTSANQGTTALGRQGALGAGGQGTNSLASRVVAASSAGLRRAPAYYTEPVFDSPVQRTEESVRSDVQEVIANSTRLPSRDSIRVTSSGDTVILRGEVRDARERRLAEALVRLTPGVHNIQNELEPRRR